MRDDAAGEAAGWPAAPAAPPAAWAPSPPTPAVMLRRCRRVQLLVFVKFKPPMDRPPTGSDQRLDGFGHLEGRLRYPRALLRPDLPFDNGMMPPAAAKPCDQSMAFAILAWRPSVPQHPVCPTPRAPVLPVC